MALDPAYADWLQAPERRVAVEDGTLSVRWGTRARTDEASSPFVVESDAQAEAARQIAFLGGPVCEEEILVPASLNVAALRGRCVNVTIAGDADYASGPLVFVLGGDVDHATGTTALAVLRRL